MFRLILNDFTFSKSLQQRCDLRKVRVSLWIIRGDGTVLTTLGVADGQPATGQAMARTTVDEEPISSEALARLDDAASTGGSRPRRQKPPARPSETFSTQ